MLPESRVIARPSPFVSACEDTRRVRCSEAAAEARTQYRKRSGEYRQPLLGRLDPQHGAVGRIRQQVQQAVGPLTNVADSLPQVGQ